MTQLSESVVRIVEKLSQQPGAIQEYEKLYIISQNLSQTDLEFCLSQHNLLNIFSHMDLSNGYKKIYQPNHVEKYRN